MSEETRIYSIPGMSCDQCRKAISHELGNVDRVQMVDIDLQHRQVHVRGSGVSDEAVRAAIEEAGYEVA